jgi:hypothetical protein
MYGERFYGANASTFVGVAGCVLGGVSLLAGLFSSGNIQILSVGSNAFASGLVSAAAVLIGGALVASRETVGGITSLLLASVLVFGGMLSINMGQFFKVLAATSDAVSKIDISVDGAKKPKSANYVMVRRLTAEEAAECQTSLKWARTDAGRRNCTAGGVMVAKQ